MIMTERDIKDKQQELAAMVDKILRPCIGVEMKKVEIQVSVNLDPFPPLAGVTR